jgi:hypothetical protein
MFIFLPINIKRKKEKMHKTNRVSRTKKSGACFHGCRIDETMGGGNNTIKATWDSKGI